MRDLRRSIESLPIEESSIAALQVGDQECVGPLIKGNLHVLATYEVILLRIEANSSRFVTSDEDIFERADGKLVRLIRSLSVYVLNQQSLHMSKTLKKFCGTYEAYVVVAFG